MNTRTLLIAAMTSIFAVTAAAPSFAAGDPVKHEKRMHRMIKRADINGDGRVSQAELTAAISKTIAVIDANNDGAISANELANSKAAIKAERREAKTAGAGKLHLAKLPMKKLSKRFAKLDANGDGQLSGHELDRVAKRMFKRGDKNRDGFISIADIKA